MSKLDKKSKFLELEGVRVTYRPKDDTIHITSKDKDLQSEGFHLTLKNGTPSEDSLRQLLTEKGLIKPTASNTLPNFAKYEFDAAPSWNEIPLGIKENNEVVFWDVLGDAHALVGGHAGAGKSIIQRAVFAHCVAHNDEWEVIGLDCKAELKYFANYPKTTSSVGSTLQEVAASLTYAISVMMERYDEMERVGGTTSKDIVVNLETGEYVRSIMIFIDEVGSMTTPDQGYSRGKSFIEENNLRARIANDVGKLARLGRAAGIHLIIAGQNLSHGNIRGEFKDNLPFRVAMGNMSPQQSNSILNSDAATRIGANVGRGYASSEFGDVESEFQAYFPSYDTIDELILRNPMIDPARYAHLVRGH
jgi:S-DNA-T family DNA segregation ATPase FtsK/SpoIIIE